MRRAAVRFALLCAVLSCTTHSGYYSTDNNNTPSGPTGPTGSTGPTTGTVVGTITTSLGGPLAGVHVVVTPAGGSAMAAVTTSNSGGFVSTSVPTSTTGGSVAVSAMPGNCPTSMTSNYTGLKGGDTVTVNITVVCSTLVGTVKGNVTSSLGGGLAGAAVVVTPHGGTALAAVPTNASGAFVAANVPIADSTGAVSVTSVPSGCTVPPSATSYTKLGYGDTATVAITVTCTGAGGFGTGTVSGTVTSSLSGPLGGAHVVVTPTGGTALPAVTTTGAGVYSVSHVPVGPGAVTISSGLPAQCATPSAVAYAGLANNGTATANIVATCQQLASLTVTVTPTPTLGSVTVTGPGGYTQSMTQTTTLTNLVPGSYSVTATPYEIPSAFVATVYNGTVTGSPANVTSGGTSNVTVSYGIRGGSGALWAFSGPAGVGYEITNAQLSASGSISTVTNSVPPGNSIAGAAVDANGTMWLVGYGGGGFGVPNDTGVFYGVTPTNLAALNLGSPAITGDPSSINTSGAAFDASGNLWLVEGGTISTFLGNPSTWYQIRGFTPAQLAAGGQFASTWSVWTTAFQGTTNAAQQPVQLAFGPHGDLWVAVVNTTAAGGSLQAFTAAQLAAGGQQTPVSTITVGDQVSGMAFDQNQNLWVGFVNQNTIVMYTQSQLAAGGALTPTVTLSGVTQPGGIAFDDSGDLWALSLGTTRLYSFSPFQLTASGTPTPQVSISFITSLYPTILAFDPHAAGLPLNGSHVIPHRNAQATTTRRRR